MNLLDLASSKPLKDEHSRRQVAAGRVSVGIPVVAGTAGNFVGRMEVVVAEVGAEVCCIVIDSALGIRTGKRVAEGTVGLGARVSGMAVVHK